MLQKLVEIILLFLLQIDLQQQKTNYFNKKRNPLQQKAMRW
jgi:hypothetical protein